MHLSHFAAHNLFISLAASTAALPAVSFSQLLSFPDIPTTPLSPTAIPSWPKCMVMPAMPAMLMLILRRVSSNGVVDVPLRQPFGDFVVIILAAFRAEAAAPWLPGSMVPWFLC